ncbi:MAG: hypothetical protein WCT14_16700 [Treponemataceae bacterium]
MKREDLRAQDESLVLEGAFKRARSIDSTRKRRRRREDFTDRLFRYLRELDR